MGRPRDAIARRGAAALAATAILAFAACGDEPVPEAGAQSFAGRADEICADLRASVAEATREAPASRSEEIVQSEAVLAAEAEVRERFDELDPGPEGAASFDALLAELDALIAADEDALAADRRGDDRAFREALERRAAAEERFRTISAELGLTACAGELPASDVRAIEALVERIQLNDDPICAEVFTTDFLERTWPRDDDPVAACNRARAEAETLPADSAEVIELRGAGRYARARLLTMVDGERNQSIASFTETEEAGWRVYEVVSDP